MSVSVEIKIKQISTDDTEAGMQYSDFTIEADGYARDELASLGTDVVQGHLPSVSQPASSALLGGWETEVPANWNSSPTSRPELLYRYRHAFGRDQRELFSYRGLLVVDENSSARWGNLDNNSGLLVYQRNHFLDTEVTQLEFITKGIGSVLEITTENENTFSVKELGKVSAFTTLSIYPFLLSMLPLPLSIKNPTTTDIYIRIANFTSVFDPDTITLYINGTVQPTLTIVEFFGGLGGFDVTWENTQSFDYDSLVEVKWEMRDKGSPSKPFEFSYTFSIVPDSAGPRVTNTIPADTAVGIPVLSTLQFDVEDPENGVDIESLVLYVNCLKVQDGITGDIVLSEFQNKKGYVVAYTPYESWLYGDLIPVSIFVKDNAKVSNTTFYSYSFTTIESTAPVMLNLRPLSCTINVPVGTHISLDLIDGGHGLDKDSVVVSVGNKEQSGNILLIPIVHREE